MWRMICRTLFVLWCLSWVPSLVGSLSDNVPGTEEPFQEKVFRPLCVLNVMIYYLAGVVWLSRESFRRADAGIGCAAWCVFLVLNPFGPVTLAVCSWILGRGKGHEDK
jgi:hypothetical protein